jgi:hypothetical protein
MTEKSILEQALLQVQTLEEAVKQNAKGILASTMKQELNDLLKESLEEEEEVAEQPTPEEKEADDMSDKGAKEGAEDSEGEEDLDNEMPAGLDSEEGEDDEYSSESEEDENPFEDEEDAMDMTGASDEEVMKVFKAMKPEDGIIVKKDGNSVHFSDGDNDYIIKLDDKAGEDMDEQYNDYAPDPDSAYEDKFETDYEPEHGIGDASDDYFDDEDMAHDEEMSEDEVIYEIELDEEEEEMKEKEETHEEEMEEAARTKSNVHGNKGGQDRAGLDSKKKYKAGSGAINEEVEKLKKQNGEYKKALVLFKEKLNEVAVFNANLAYSTRLFTEHSTTKQEKLNILKRFDGINNMNESKALFNTIKNELETKNPITETVANKISNTPTTSSSKEMLAESKAYENPQFKRMKDLMSKIK